MAIIKCKMCGGDLNITESVTVAECEYCGSKQTIPNQDSEKKLTLFARADRLRRSCEFDKAAGVYESIVAEFPEEAEAYWGLVLCRYGIEYVDDPATSKKVPTCHRSSFDSILEDADFDQACENADAIARRMYREEARVIEDIRRRILEVSAKEVPYDIFICYKETDENGGRTIDSVIAQDVYNALIEKDYRVFFSRISLEDKLGSEYEPYIFAALNSAKIMLVFGTDFEYFNAVWVKNEWSRFLALIASGQKKTLIPCYKGVDAYDMPKEFQRLQAQDMGKVGAIQDLMRGIEKILPRQTETVKETVIIQQTSVPAGPGVQSLLERGNISLEDENWEKAKELFDQVLNIDPKSAEAYLGLLMAQKKFRDWDALTKAGSENLLQEKNMQRARQYAGAELAARLAQIEEDVLAGRYAIAVKAQELATGKWETCVQLQAAIKTLCTAEGRFRAIIPYRDSAQRADTCTQESVRLQKQLQQKLQEGRIATAGMLATTSSASGTTMVGVKENGTVVATGHSEYFSCDVDAWRNIIAVAVAYARTVGLKADGTVITSGIGMQGECDVDNWRNIVAIAVGSSHTVGLKTDGMVVATGDNKYGQCSVNNWRNIVAIATGDNHTVGLKTDGTVVATGGNTEGQCDVSSWRDIVAVFANKHHTVGLKTNGTLVTVGRYSFEKEYDINNWKNIVAAAVGYKHIVGLKSDGTVVATGDNDNGRCNVSNWRDIVAVFADMAHTVGLKSDGTVVVAGHSEYGDCNVQKWKLFNSMDTLDQARAALIRKGDEARRKRQETEQQQREAERQRQEVARKQRCVALESERQRLQSELPNLKGMFANMKRRQIESRLAQIEAELRKLQ